MPASKEGLSMLESALGGAPSPSVQTGASPSGLAMLEQAMSAPARPASGASSSGLAMLEAALSGEQATPTTVSFPKPKTADLESNKIWSSTNFIGDLMDAINLPQYNLMRLLTGKGAKGLYGERYAPSDWLNENVWSKTTNPIVRGVGNLGADLIVDPINIAALPVKAGVEGAKALTVGGMAWEGLGKLYKAVGAVGPVEHFATKLASNPFVRWLDEDMGFGISRVARAQRGAYKGFLDESGSAVEVARNKLNRALTNADLGPNGNGIVNDLVNLDAEHQKALVKGHNLLTKILTLNFKFPGLRNKADEFLLAAGERPPESTIIRDMARWDTHYNAEARPAEIVRGLLGNSETNAAGYDELAAEMLDKAKTKAKGFLDYGGNQKVPDYYRTLPFGEKDARPLNRVLQIYRSAAASNMDVAEMLRKQLPSLERRETSFYKKWGAARPTEAIPLGELRKGYDAAWQKEVAPVLATGRKIDKAEDAFAEVQKVRDAADMKRAAMLDPDSPYFLEKIVPAAQAAGMDPMDYAGKVRDTFDEIMRVDHDFGATAFKLGVYGDPTTEEALRLKGFWDGNHLKNVYALMGEPELFAKHIDANIPMLTAAMGDMIKGKHPDIFNGRNTIDIEDARALIDPEVAGDAAKLKAAAASSDEAFTLYAESKVRERGQRYLDEMFAKESAAPNLRPGPIPTAWAKKRVYVDEVAQKMLWPVSDAILRAGIGGREVIWADELTSLFQKIADTPSLMRKPGDPDVITIAAGMNGKVDERLAKTWGALAGRTVDRILFKDLSAINRPLPEYVQNLAKYVTPWKRWRSTRNPATIVRNILGNIALAHIVGNLGPMDLNYYGKAASRVTSRAFAEGDLPEHLSGMLMRGDLNDLNKEREAIRVAFGLSDKPIGEKVATKFGLNKIYNGFNKVMERLDNGYGTIEMVFKDAVYLKEMDRLKAVGVIGEEANKQAVALAEKALFNYRDVPRGLDILRRTGVMPFLCVDPKTEVLSERGWLLHDELTEGDKVLSFNMESQHYEWKRVVGITREHYQGPMRHIKTRTLDMMLTPNHRCVVRGWKQERPRFVEAKDLNITDRIPLAADYPGADTQTFTDDFVRLIGWVFAEGSISKQTIAGRDYYHVAIWQCIGGVESIRGLLNRPEFAGRWTESSRVRSTTVNGRSYNAELFCFNLAAELGREVRDVLPEKQLSLEFLLKLTKDQLQILKNVLIQTDGTTDKNGRQSIVQHQKRSDGVALLLVLCGQSFGDCKHSESIRQLTLRTGREATLRHARIDDVDYDGLVWCPTVEDNETWVARRNGKVFVTGNTFPYKALPILVEATFKNPQRLSLYMRKLPHNIEAMDPDYRERKEAEAALVPEYARGTMSPRLPNFPVGAGRYAQLDPMFIVPDVFPESGTQGNAVQSGLQGALGMLGPVPKGIIEVGTGRRIFAGGKVPVVGSGENPWAAYARYIGEQVVPPYAPGGYGTKPIIGAATSPTATNTFTEALAGIAGLRTYNVEKQQIKRANSR